VPHIRPLPTGFPTFSLDLGLFVRHPEWIRDLVLGALALAAISSMDTLLTCVLADAVVGQKTKGDRELVAQGVANTAAGIFGANQACGAAVRTMVNIRNGGRTRLSGLSHAVFLLLFVLVGASLATLVPIAVLAGILLTTGVGMIEWRAILEAHKAPRSDTLVMVVTTIAVIAAGLIEAVVIGLVLAALLFVKRMTELTDFVGEPEWTGRPREGLGDIEGEVLVYEVRGPLFFGAASRFTQTMERADLKAKPVVVFRMNSVTTIDETGLRAVEVIIERLQRNRQHVILAHVPLETARKMDRFGLLARVGAENVVPDWPSAVSRARALLGKDRSTE
jgi:SulP family sulfate permease